MPFTTEQRCLFVVRVVISLAVLGCAVGRISDWILATLTIAVSTKHCSPIAVGNTFLALPKKGVAKKARGTVSLGRTAFAVEIQHILSRFCVDALSSSHRVACCM